MNAEQTVQTVFTAFEAGDFDRALSMLSADFTFSGVTPVPLTGPQFIAVVRALRAAMPDWSFNYQLVKAQGNQVSGVVSITGTQTQELVLPMPDFPRVAATGKKVALPKERQEFSLSGDKITSLEVESVPGGGVLGVLKQLGVAFPQH